jgi:hypothetical protein
MVTGVADKRRGDWLGRADRCREGEVTGSACGESDGDAGCCEEIGGNDDAGMKGAAEAFNSSTLEGDDGEGGDGTDAIAEYFSSSTIFQQCRAECEHVFRENGVVDNVGDCD